MNKVSCSLGLHLLANNAFAYETPVHAKMGLEAFKRSNIVFQSELLLPRYGLDRLNQQAQLIIYYSDECDPNEQNNP